MPYEGAVIFSYASGVGGILTGGGSTYILADGRFLPKATYPALYAVVSGRYGETVNDFRIPDMRGYYLRATDQNTGRDPDRNSRVLFGPGAISSGVGSVQPASLLAHIHQDYGDTPANFNAAPSSSVYWVGNPAPAITKITSGVWSASLMQSGTGVSGISITPSGVINPPTYTYYAYVKAT